MSTTENLHLNTVSHPAPMRKSRQMCLCVIGGRAALFTTVRPCHAPNSVRAFLSPRPLSRARRPRHACPVDRGVRCCTGSESSADVTADSRGVPPDRPLPGGPPGPWSCLYAFLACEYATTPATVIRYPSAPWAVTMFLKTRTDTAAATTPLALPSTCIQAQGPQTTHVPVYAMTRGMQQSVPKLRALTVLYSQTGDLCARTHAPVCTCSVHLRCVSVYAHVCAFGCVCMCVTLCSFAPAM